MNKVKKVPMVSWVSSKIIIKNANKKGVGSFANEPISKGEVVVVQGGRIMDYTTIAQSDYKPFCDHCFQIEKDLLICPIEPKAEMLDGIFHVNHSCNPTCGFRGHNVLIAMKDIQIDEEITYDYAMTDANQYGVTCAEMTCLCNEKNCRHIITGDDWERKDLQETYSGYFSTFIQELIKSYT